MGWYSTTVIVEISFDLQTSSRNRTLIFMSGVNILAVWGFKIIDLKGTEDSTLHAYIWIQNL